MHKSISGALMVVALIWAHTAAAQEAQVGIDAGGDAFLYGNLLKPAGTASLPAVLIVPGLGANHISSDGPGIDPKPSLYKQLAQALAAKGIASLRIDIRGFGTSAGAKVPDTDLRLDTYVDDTVSWVKFLKLQPRVKCVVLLGHSEGGLIAALAAKKVDVCGLIEVSAAGLPAGELIANQLKAAYDASKLSKETYDQAVHILAELRAGRTVANVPSQLNGLFSVNKQPYLISWLNRDPVEAAKGLVPTQLVLQGDHDPEISPVDARRLANVTKRTNLVILPGVDHELRLAQGDSTDKFDEAERPLAPSVAAAIADYVSKLK